jgi:helicase/secretion neighborhood TadE-like protein
MTVRGGESGDPGEGSGSVAVVGILAVALVLCAFLLVLGAVHTQVVRARAVADLAALAGGDASAVSGWTDAGSLPCERAAAVAGANGMGLGACTVSGRDTLVVVRGTLVLAGVPVPVEARARAGPAPQIVDVRSLHAPKSALLRGALARDLIQGGPQPQN